MSKILNRVSELSPDKLDSLVQRLSQNKSSGTSRTLIPRRHADSAPLSFAQTRLWYVEQLKLGSSTYNLHLARRLKGELDISALELSLTEIVRRHETLRTIFMMRDGEPVQVVASAQPVTLPLIDLSNVDERAREESVRRVALEKAQEPFDLERGPLWRASLLRLYSHEHVLLVMMHHIIADDWSLDIFNRELNVLYRTYTQGQASPLAEPPIQYSDYAAWQRERFQSKSFEKQMVYWSERLTGATALELPADRPRPSMQNYRGASVSFLLPPGLTDHLRAVSRREDATLFMILLAGYYVLLHRYTGEKDIVVGAPIAERPYRETEGLIGFFVNNLVLRIDLSGDPPFREFLRRVRTSCLGAYAHQELPFEAVMENLQLARTSGHNPLLQVLFQLRNVPRRALALEGMNMSGFRFEGDETVRWDVYLSLRETGRRVGGALGYSTELFDESTMQRMVSHFVQLLESIVSNPDRRISQLTLLTPVEHQQLTATWNNTTAAYASDRNIHHLFETQVQESPEKAALVFRDEQLSYHDLNCRANQLAHHLLRLGIGQEKIVGIAIERSIDMIVAVLGVLKAGAAYLPLDLEYPTQRLSFMLEDAAPALVLTHRSLQDKLPPHDALVVLLDDDWEMIALESPENPTSAVGLQSLAYVIYTSGSTGQPKGVQVEHHGLVSLSVAQVLAYGIDSTDRVLQCASLSFDISIYEIVMALTHGATLYLPSPEALLVGQTLFDTLREYEITTVTLPPSVMMSVPEGSLPALRTLIVGAEVCPPSLAERWSKGRRFINAYGPTEGTVLATVTEPLQDAGKPPIGRAISNVRVFVMDEQMQLVPVGVKGELHLGGAGIARGYLNRPELTAEKFVPDPYSGVPGARLYKTGDFVRYLPDGQLDFIGRKDHQIKLRGFRIELGEIETALSRHPAVSECIVLLREDAPDEKQLVAYVVNRRDYSVTSGELREHLSRQLPDHMLPAFIVIMAAFPLTPNGKIDRRALPAPVALVWQNDSYVAPRTAIEEILVNIWSEVLHVERIGIHDNFFDLGGHSLLAMQVLSRIGEVFRVSIEAALHRIFESPTVASLAECIEQAGSQVDGPPPISVVSREEDLPLSFAQQRLWFLDQLEPQKRLYHIVLARQLSGDLKLEALERSVSEIVRRHEILRTRFLMKDGVPLQVIDAPQSITVPVTDLRSLIGAERQARVDRILSEESATDFDLSRGPLLRVRLLQLSDGEYVLIFSLHHIIADGWSIGIFNRELTQLYQSYLCGAESPLEPLTIQYADYAAWQNRYLQDDALSHQFSYWEAQLRDAPANLALPTDRPRTTSQAYRGQGQPVKISPEVSNALRQLARAEGVTIFMLLLAAFQTLLCRFSGQDDIVVGTPIAGRKSQTGNLIGHFLNTLAMRLDLAGNPSFREVLRRARAMCLGAFANQDLPFEKLVAKLRPGARGHSPLFQVWFVLQNAPKAALRLEGLDLESFGIDRRTAVFDLILAMRETGDRFQGWLVYNTDLFESETVTEFIDCYQNLLERIAVDPEQTILNISLEPVRPTPLRNDPQTQASADAEPEFVFEAGFDQAFTVQSD
jgi:amino acid adenylation domain-containing protein